MKSFLVSIFCFSLIGLKASYAVNNQQYSRSSSVVFEMIEDARIEKGHTYSDYEWLFNAGLSFVESPLTVKNSNNSQQTDTIIDDMLALHLGASWYIRDYLQLGVQTYFAQFEQSFSGEGQSGIGDIDLRLKLRVFNDETSALSIMPQVTLPTSAGEVDLIDSSGTNFGEDSILSDEGVGYGLNLIYEKVFKKFQLALNLGILFNSDAEFRDNNGISQIDFTQRLKTGFGFYIPMSHKWGVNIEYLKFWSRPLFNDDINPNELFLGSSFGLKKGLTGFAGLGLGNVFDSDDGNDYRFSFGVKYSPSKATPVHRSVRVIDYKKKVEEKVVENVIETVIRKEAPKQVKIEEQKNAPVTIKKEYTCGVAKAFGKTNKALYYYGNNIYKLGPNQRQNLDVVAKILIKREDQIAEVSIYGHTSSVASSDYNMILGRNRAKTVRDYLMSKGVNPNLLVQVESLGEEALADDGDTEASHKNNRRTEVLVKFNDEYKRECL